MCEISRTCIAKRLFSWSLGWGYVTSQSIAQVIRSLRLSLDDINKNIIVTIPKLGYQFTAQPSDKEPEKTSQSQHMTSQGRLDEKELIFRMSSGNIKKSEFSTLNMDKSCSLKKKKTSTENFRLRKAFFLS
ncbi:transcriptional regulator [Erwinia amylovora MR1]|nr:transcriptional regulator [Erwinia amylovora MR1]